MRSRADSKLPPDVVPAPVLNPGDTPMPGRTIIRKEGCWNCLHWNNGDLFNQHRLARRLSDMKTLISSGMPLQTAEARLQSGDRFMSSFSYGVCLGGGGKADFVPARYKCNKWSGRIRTEGRQDDLVEEIKDKLGEPT